MIRSTLLFASFAVLGSSLTADEIRLRDGRVLVGDVEVLADGGYLVHTLNGDVTVRFDEVLSRRTDGELRKELLRLARTRGRSTFDQLQLAVTARRYGLEKDMWRYLDKAIAEAPEDGAIRRRLFDLLGDLEPELVPLELRQGKAGERLAHLLNQVRGGVGDARRAAILELLVHTEGADGFLRDAVGRGLLSDQRQIALEALQRRPAKGNREFVWRAAVLSNDRKARDLAAGLVRADGRPAEAIRYLTPGLFSDRPEIRIRTAEAFANLEHADAVPVLVMAGPLAGTPKALADGRPGVRAHMSQLQHRSYIRDFEVEIAQAAAVANPVVDAVSSGVVLDATVAAVVAQQVQIATSYRRALNDLVGADPGANPNDWLDWLAKRDPKAASRVMAPVDLDGAVETAPKTGAGSGG